MAQSNDAKIAMEQGMMIVEVNPVESEVGTKLPISALQQFVRYLR